jgi:predicted RecB family nuclease
MITSEVVVSYSQCILKAYLLLCEGKKGITHEYMSILGNEGKKNRREYLSNFRTKITGAKPYSYEKIKKGIPILIEANLEFEALEAYADILTRVENISSQKHHHYTPTLVIGTHKINKEQKLQLGFIAYILSKLQKEKAVSGTIVRKGNKPHKIKLEPLYKEIESTIRELRMWTTSQPQESPPIILNKHCPPCPFREECEAKAKKSDHLSLLDKISTTKQIKKYERKGIFTVNQLSYLYRPRRQRKRSRTPPSVKHSLELQALVLRTGTIYLHTPPELLRNQIELFLDIEGIPDKQHFYLIGLLICEENNSSYYSFWADDTITDESQIWLQIVEILGKYADCPIYHYGNYEAKVIATLGKRYETETEGILKRLVNVNNYIYGKVYFPVRSNSLKEIGQFIGASWTSPDASGLQSLVWRYHWENSQKMEYKQKLVIYNHEDCQALKLLVDFLYVIKERDDSLLDIDCFIHSKKSRSTKVKNPLHRQLESILNFAHADYDKKKIYFREENESNKDSPKKPVRTTPLRKYRRVTKVIQVPKASECQKCGNKSLQESKTKSERIQVDLVFTKNGVRKSVKKYWALYAYCQKCKRYSKSPEFSVSGRPKIYGYGFKIWIVYLRVALRLPYRNIIMAIEDMFNERLAINTITDYLQEVAYDYAQTEGQIIQKLLDSPFLHVDETLVNIDHINQYVWGFTDGKHVVFKYTLSRDASFVHEFLADYEGVLISDFYPGYDSLNCKHQKCLVHIIRDLNNDLWSNPFDVEFGNFVSEIKNLLVPIMEAIQKYGLKKRNLNKFKRAVEKFYVSTIIDHSYKSDLCSKYQERFIKYRESLFTFIEQDGIPWHNNPAENALRAITLQLNISGGLHKSVIEEYLVLLGIKQTCKFQDKSFLKFLLSKEKDVDFFKGSKSRKPIT